MRTGCGLSLTFQVNRIAQLHAGHLHRVDGATGGPDRPSHDNGVGLIALLLERNRQRVIG